MKNQSAEPQAGNKHSEGHVLTPAEPTDAMYEAGYRVLCDIHSGPFQGSPSLGHAGDVFRAMLKVAPKNGFALVPLRMTAAMEEVVQQEDWAWADLLAAAEAVTEDAYNVALG